MKSSIYFMLILFFIITQVFSSNSAGQEKEKLELYVETGHSDPIETIAFSPDNKLLASGGIDSTIKIWDASTLQELKTLIGHRGVVRFLSFSLDGKIIVSSDGSRIKAWSVETGIELQNYEIDDGLPRTLVGTFDYKGNTIVYFIHFGKIVLLDILANKEINVFEYDANTPLFSFSSSFNGKTIAAGFKDGTTILWDVETGKEIKTFFKYANHVVSVSFSPDGKSIAGIYGNTIKVWEINTGQEIKTFEGNTDSIVHIAFSPDGKRIAGNNVSFKSENKIIKLWDAQSGREIKAFQGQHLFVFSPDGKYLATSGFDKTINLWNADTGQEIRTITGLDDQPKSIAFNSSNQLACITWSSESIILWNLLAKNELTTVRKVVESGSIALSPNGDWIGIRAGTAVTFWNTHTGVVEKLNILDKSVFSFAPDGHTVAFHCLDYVSSCKNKIELWDLRTQQKSSKTFDLIKFDVFHGTTVFEPTGKWMVTQTGNSITWWNAETNREINNVSQFSKIDIDENAERVAIGYLNGSIRILNSKTGDELKTFSGSASEINYLEFSPDGKQIVSQERANPGEIKLWNLDGSDQPKIFKTGDKFIFSPDWKILATLPDFKTIKLFSSSTGKELMTLERNHNGISTNEIFFSEDGRKIASNGSAVQVWNVETGEELVYLENLDESGATNEANVIKNDRKLIDVVPTAYENRDRPFNPTKKWKIKKAENGKVNLVELKTDKIFATLISNTNGEWIVSTPDGRFDTNKSLDRIEGLHWIISDEILKPLSLDVFMRQYFEPNLLARVVKCKEENNCDLEFKPLPTIAEINRVQPKVSIKEIKSVANSSELADVTVEVESATEDVSTSADDRTKKVKLNSGAFDLRLFRDGQLVGVSTPKAKLEPFIKAAPDLVGKNKEYFKRTGKLTNTPEDVAWREANDIFALVGAENVKRISPEKLEYTFRNVKLPKGQTSVDFTAYAFNSDRVKSTTTEPFKFEVPKTIAAARKKGRAYLVSIGVNASENPAYDLRYAANDARKMQEIVGTRLEADSGKYAEVVKIPLVSDYDKNKNLTENAAQKAIIKGVFSRLSGNEKEVSPEILKQIPNGEQIKQIEPEDTLIITFSGHGYADQSGIFYLLPYDIGKDTLRLSPATLQKTVSSDELSLWMQDITAAEMIMIIDACHSSAAVQGDGFKPGPMGSRGLGQLAYDKDMKILSATQADNVALELGSLQQGLLSYALLEDGIVKSLADTDKDKKLFSDEWLGFAEKRVPELYSEVKDGRRDIIIDGKVIKSGGNRTAEIISSVGKKNGNLDLQQPTVFDFKRRNAKNVLFSLP